MPRIFGLYCREEIDEEGEDVEGEDEGDGPFEDCRGVIVFFVACDAEGDGEGDFEEDEGQFDPEGDSQDAVFAEVNS